MDIERIAFGVLSLPICQEDSMSLNEVEIRICQMLGLSEQDYARAREGVALHQSEDKGAPGIVRETATVVQLRTRDGRPICVVPRRGTTRGGA